MKNKKLFLVATVIILAVSSVSLFSKFKASKNDNLNKSLNSQQNIFTSVKDALKKDISMICEFKDDKGISTKSYIKNGSLRISGTGEIIIQDNKMKMWDPNSKTGFVYDLDSSNTETIKTENYLEMIDRYKDSCKVTTVDDSYFIAPQDIKFQDMSKLFEELNTQKNQQPQ